MAKKNEKVDNKKNTLRRITTSRLPSGGTARITDADAM
jgi:hypothetical protein